MLKQVYLGTSTGMIVVLDVRNGGIIAEIQMPEPGPVAGSPSVRVSGADSTSGSPSWSPSPTPPSSSSTPSGPLPNGIRQLAWNCPRFKMEEPASAPAASAANNASNHSGSASTDPSAPQILPNVPGLSCLPPLHLQRFVSLFRL